MIACNCSSIIILFRLAWSLFRMWIYPFLCFRACAMVYMKNWVLIGLHLPQVSRGLISFIWAVKALSFFLSGQSLFCFRVTGLWQWCYHRKDKKSCSSRWFPRTMWPNHEHAPWWIWNSGSSLPPTCGIQSIEEVKVIVMDSVPFWSSKNIYFLQVLITTNADGLRFVKVRVRSVKVRFVIIFFYSSLSSNVFGSLKA